MIKKLGLGIAVFFLLPGIAAAQYAGWQYSGSLYILTTPEGANLPATASVENFPLLVRLSKETFDFSQAAAKGEDIRFSAEGKTLAYQIEEWDAAQGAASIWVRIPVIKGNAQQEIKMHWGKTDAASESSGSAVFNAANGYVGVLHMSDPVKDDVGVLSPTNQDTTACAGIIGQARHFEERKGIACGETITTFPSGDSSHSSEAWFKADEANAAIMAWGNEQAQGKVYMNLASPPHVRMDCYFSGGNVEGKTTLPTGQWIHVVHTYQSGNARIYINGVLDGSNAGGGPMAIKSPAKMWVGGWYNNFRFAGDIDEVRISKVVRSADWIKLEYENQKAQQTLVGSLVKPGTAFSVAPAVVKVDEGKKAAVAAVAGGARKVYWLATRAGTSTVVAVDKYSYTLDAGRVVGDTSFALQFKAVYAGKVKSKDIPVTISEAVPEPVVKLSAPAKWNGREVIEVVPVISNLEAMKAKGVATLRYTWTVSGGAVIKTVAPDKLVLVRSQYTGPITVKATVENGGARSVATAKILVTEPKTDPWVQRSPGKDEKPEAGQFYARDDKNEGTLYYNGTLSNAADSVFLKLYEDDKLIKTESLKPGADMTYAFTVKLKPGLIKYKVEVGTKTGGTETLMDTVTNLVCGDAYLIDGQSNALATDTGEKSPPDTSEWIRSYGRPRNEESGPRQNLWCYPVWKAQQGEKAELGWWGMELAKRLVASQKIPIFIINGAVGGTRIDQHQRNEANPTDVATIYGRILGRVQQARLTHGIRGILWHQGENNQGSASPTGDFDWKSYQQYFVDMSAAWKQDFPNVQHYYLFQIWPNSCSMAGNSRCGDMIREMQRTLPRLYSHMGVMSTLGMKPAGPCHYPLAGWSEFARLIQPLIERDNYGKVATTSITPPDLKRAYYTGATKDAIALEFDQPVVWTDALIGQFYLEGTRDKVASGAVVGTVVTLKLKEPSAARTITYLQETDWSQEKLIMGANGIAALTFCDVVIAPTAGTSKSGD